MKQIVLILIFIIANAFASDKVITYSDFVHFNHEQKIETIKLVHQFLIAYETLPKAKKDSKKLKRKYKKYSKLFSLFINNAYAVDFNVSQDMRDRMCFYAGWVSFSRADGTCAHPLSLNPTLENDPVAKAINAELEQAALASTNPGFRDFFQQARTQYESAIDGGRGYTTIKYSAENGFILEPGNSANCSKPYMVLCNPTLYGTDPRGSSGKPFCVTGNSNNGINSSLLCSKAREALTSPQDQAALSAEIVSRAMAGNAPNNEFFYLLKTMYDTCLCGGDKPSNAPIMFSGTIDARYANKLFYNRTCFGIINQTQQIDQILINNENTCRVIKDNNITGSAGPNWFDFLSKANDVLFREQTFQDHIKNYVDDRAIALGLQTETTNEAYQKEQDNQIMRQLRADHMQKYYDEKLCPIGAQDFGPSPVSPLPVVPATNITATAQDLPNDPTKSLVIVTFSAPDLSEASIALVPRDGEASITPQDSLPPENNALIQHFHVSKTGEPQQLIANGLISGSTVATFYIAIPALANGKFLSANVTDKVGDNTKSVVTVSLEARGTEQLRNPEIGLTDPNSEGAYTFPILSTNRDNPNTLIQIYEIAKARAEVTLKAKGIDGTWSETRDVIIPALTATTNPGGGDRPGGGPGVNPEEIVLGGGATDEDENEPAEQPDYTLELVIRTKADDASKSIATVTLQAKEGITIPSDASLFLKRGSTAYTALTETPTTTTSENRTNANQDQQPQPQDQQPQPQNQDQQPSDRTLVKRFEIAKEAAEFKVNATTSVNNALNKEGTIPAIGAVTPNPAEEENITCEVKLAENSDGKSLKTSYSFAGTTYPDGDLMQPEGYTVSLKYYDTLANGNSNESTNTKTKNTLDSIREDHEEADTPAEKDSDIDRAIATIRENVPYNDDEEVENRIVDPYPFAESNTTRIVAVILEISKGSEVICKHTAYAIREPIFSAPGNDNPVRLNGAPRMIRGGGRILGGQR